MTGIYTHVAEDAKKQATRCEPVQMQVGVLHYLDTTFCKTFRTISKTVIIVQLGKE